MPHSHYHDKYEIYYFLGDKMTYFIDNRSYQLEKHDMILVNKYIYHKTFYKNNMINDRINISFNDEFLKLFFDEDIIKKVTALFKIKRYRIISVNRKNEVFALFNKLTDLYLNKKDIVHSHIALADLLLTLSSINEEKQFEEEYSELTSVQIRTAQIIQYINTHFKEQITLNSIANEYFISKYYLSRTFSSQTGLSVTDFINRKRITEASLLIKNTQMKITDIALNCGFLNMSHFSLLFKRVYSVTPREYKKSVFDNY